MAIGLNPNLIYRNKDDKEKEKVKIQEDYARVEIYYQTLNLKTIEQSPTVSVRIKIFTFSSALETVIEGVSRVQKVLKILVWGVEPKVRPLPNVKRHCGPCKSPQLLLADENEAFFYRDQ